jgi:hypothetical protein
VSQRLSDFQNYFRCRLFLPLNCLFLPLLGLFWVYQLSDSQRSQTSFDSPFFRSLADGHRQWLAQFEPQHLADWKKLFNGNPEAALCEAATRERLQGHSVTVEPYDKPDPNSPGPDFRCSIRDRPFYVEVTCISIDSATKKTGIPEGGHNELRPFKIFGMTQAIFQKCGPKTKQCEDLDAPVLVAIGTFHSDAALASLKPVLIGSVLTGKMNLSWTVDTTTGQQIGETQESTTLDSAAFLRLNDETDEVEPIRSPVSGVLLCGLTLSADFIGVLHPQPCRPFDPSWLPKIEFGSVEIDQPNRQLRVVWSNTNE